MAGHLDIAEAYIENGYYKQAKAKLVKSNIVMLITTSL